MPEYISMKAALHVLDLVMTDETIKHTGKAIRKRLKELPRGDMVEVVRCKDCEDYNGHRYCEYHAVPVLDDDFCSYGHKEEGTK